MNSLVAPLGAWMDLHPVITVIIMFVVTMVVLAVAMGWPGEDDGPDYG